MFQILMVDQIGISEVRLLANGILELKLSINSSIDEALIRHQGELFEVIYFHFIALFAQNDFPRTFEHTSEGMVIKPNYCNMPATCISAEFLKL